MQFERITKEYYAKYLGIELSEIDKAGVFPIYSADRNSPQYGYCTQHDVVVFHQHENMIISYGDNAKDKINDLTGQLSADMTIQEVSKCIEETWGQAPSQLIKFVYHKIPEMSTSARPLTSWDYPLYLDFFKINNPNCADTSWVREYFDEMVEKEYCFGVLCDGTLASATDAPGMPYMQDRVQEIGINTVPDYRGKGYAVQACIAVVRKLISKDICPLWSTSIDNIASQRLAYHIGFTKLADALLLSL